MIVQTQAIIIINIRSITILLNLLLCFLYTTDLNISGDYQNLRVGSTVVINCTAPAGLIDRTLSWRDPNGTVLITSSAMVATLILAPVNYSTRGTYTCSVSSPQLTVARNKAAEVSVQGIQYYFMSNREQLAETTTYQLSLDSQLVDVACNRP